MKSNIISYLTLAAIIVFQACSSSQISSALKSASTLLGDEQELTTAEVIAGLKEALEKGAANSITSVSRADGYFGNPKIKIPFPPEIAEMENKLRQIGLNKPVDDFILSINRAAEKAAAEAKPLFVEAIRNMTIEDGWSILRGENDAATQYLQKATSSKLESRFEPIIAKALNTVNATKYYQDMATAYNKIPFVTEVETDLTAYVNQLAIKGLFKLVAEEEGKIREDPLARTTELLKRVFSEQ